MHDRIKRTDIPARVPSILQLLKDNLSNTTISISEALNPFCYQTDGGTYNDDFYYFINNIFSKTGVCHSTRVPKNANIQAYLGRKIFIDTASLQPKNFKSKSNQNMITIPFEDYLVDKSEEETFKLIKELVIHNMGWGYTCFVSAFAIFISDKEINCQKSHVIQYFNSINTVQDFEALKLPIKQTVDCPDGTANKAFEIDLSQQNKVAKCIGISKLDCFPILWLASQPS